MLEIKTVLDRIKKRLDTKGKMINELEEITMETIQNKTHREKSLKKL